MYQPLDRSQREIRILYLLLGKCDDPVRCELHIVSLSDKPGYEALSYAWGNQSVRFAIEVDGEEAYITTNLYNGLRRLRLTERTRHIWADALCINQSDDVERSNQVGLMRDIYSLTNQAILWLGDFSDAESGTGLVISPSDGNYIYHKTAEEAFSLLQSMAASHHWASREPSEQAAVRTKFDALSVLLNLS
ncbi:heterokaryon incompatibility protein-domain-containing protein [Fusarium avenaceum]|nr:heterokaryon incompatibility protein-domain-containing protein [Fusarium avenaceum]